MSEWMDDPRLAAGYQAATERDRRESPDGRTGFERLVERDRLVERRAHPRRRADDWKDTSLTKVSSTALRDLATMLGYDPETVVSVRMNRREAVVTYRMPETGLPRCVRHEMVDE